MRTILAWGVHCYTASGLIAAAGIAVLIVRGDADAFRWAFLLMILATVIDATDGSLARLVRVKEVVPTFDGRRLDDLVDFLTYTSLPLFLLWRANLPAEGLTWCLLIPLLASAYGFCQVSVKTDDGFFLGFPSYWNLVAFYIYILRTPPWVSLTILLGLSFLTFVPTRYLYPTQRGRINRVTNLLGAAWAGMLGWVVLRMSPEPSSSRALDADTYPIALLSLFFPFYYLLTSWLLSLHFWVRMRRVRDRLPPPGEASPVSAPRWLDPSEGLPDTSS